MKVIDYDLQPADRKKSVSTKTDRKRIPDDLRLLIFAQQFIEIPDQHFKGYVCAYTGASSPLKLEKLKYPTFYQPTALLADLDHIISHRVDPDNYKNPMNLQYLSRAINQYEKAEKLTAHALFEIQRRGKSVQGIDKLQEMIFKAWTAWKEKGKIEYHVFPYWFYWPNGVMNLWGYDIKKGKFICDAVVSYSQELRMKARFYLNFLKHLDDEMVRKYILLWEKFYQIDLHSVVGLKDEKFQLINI